MTARCDAIDKIFLYNQYEFNLDVFLEIVYLFEDEYKNEAKRLIETLNNGIMIYSEGEWE